MDGRSTEEIVTSLETLALDQHIQRGSGIPSERWSVASGLTIHVPNKSKRNTKEKHSDSLSSSSSSSSEENDNSSSSEEDSDGNSNNNSDKEEKDEDEDEDEDNNENNENSASSDEDIDDEEEVFVEDNLERRFLGTIRFCARYVAILEQYIEIDKLNSHHPTKKPVIGKEDDNVLVIPEEDEDSDLEEEEDNSIGSNSSSSDDDEEANKRKEEEKQAKETAKILAAQKRRRKENRKREQAAIEPQTMQECLYHFRALQIQLAIILHDLLLPHSNKKCHTINEKSLASVVEVLEPVLTKSVLTLCDEPPLTNPNYFTLRARAADSLFSCRLRTYNTLANYIDIESDCLEEIDTLRTIRKKKPGYWVCHQCHLVNQPNTKTCISCHEKKKIPLDSTTQASRERREKYRALHLRAATRAKFSAELCEDVAKRYPLQSAHSNAQLFRVLEARSLLAAARAVPLDYGKKAATNSVLLAQNANENLTKYWRHETSMLLEGRAVLYGCLWLRMIEDFTKTRDLFHMKKYKTSSTRYRAMGKNLVALMEIIEEDIVFEEKQGVRSDYIVVGGGEEDWRQSTKDNPQDWESHEDEHGRKYWYSPSTKRTTQREPPPPKAIVKRRSLSAFMQGDVNAPPSPLPKLKLKKQQVFHLGFHYWGERIHLAEPLGHHMGDDFPFVDVTLIDYQFGQMTVNDPLITNPLLHLMRSFGNHIKTLAVRCLANAGASRDKNHQFEGAQRAFVDGLNLLSGATSKSKRQVLVALNHGRLSATIRRYAVTSMHRHLLHTASKGCQFMEGPLLQRDYRSAVIMLDDAVETAEVYIAQVVRYQMTNAAKNMRRTQLKICCHLGMALEKIHQYEAATEAYDRAVQLSRDIEHVTKDRREEIKCMMRIAVVLMKGAKNSADGIAMGAAQYSKVKEACRRPLSADLIEKNGGFDIHMINWLQDASVTCLTRTAVAELWFDVEKKGRKHYAADVLQKFWRMCVIKRFQREMRERRRNNMAIRLQCTFRRWLAKRLVDWKRLVRDDKRVGVPLRHQTTRKLQRWWHQLAYELREGRDAGVYFAIIIQRYYRGHVICHRLLPKKKRQALLEARHAMKSDQTVQIQKIYRGYHARKKFTEMTDKFQKAVWREYLDEQVGYIQRLGRYYLAKKRRAYLAELRNEASTLQLRENSSIKIQTRMYRGPRDRAIAYYLRSIRTVQRYYRGFHIRRRENRVWRSLGTLSWRPKPTGRKVSFFGAEKMNLFSGGKNNWELKERMGALPNHVLHELGTKKRKDWRKVIKRPVFYDRKEQTHRRKMKQLQQTQKDDRQLAGVYLCKKCLQRAKYPGHVCCCHVRGLVCRNCAKNQRSLKVYGRPKTLLCQKRKVPGGGV
jgi:hypothetical protein